MADARLRLYDDLSSWWPLMSPPAHYVEEADDLLSILRDPSVPGPSRTLLELGSGGGSLAFHLKPHFTLTLTDRSPGMLAVSQTVNPECEHILGDMTTLDLERQFDRVLVHDAVMYATTETAVRATLRTVARHCRRGGLAVVVPDCVRETFSPDTEHGGEDSDDGRALRYLLWTSDPDPSDTTFETVYGFVLRDADGSVRMELDRHLEGLFPRADWLRWFDDAGFDVRIHADPFGREVFMARRRA